MISMSDVEFARTVHFDTRDDSIFIWTEAGFAVELNRHEFLAEFEREFALVPVAPRSLFECSSALTCANAATPVLGVAASG